MITLKYIFSKKVNEYEIRNRKNRRTSGKSILCYRFSALSGPGWECGTVLRDRRAELLHKFADIILKLNCFYDFKVYRNDSSRGYLNPKPESLEKWLLENPMALNILISEENTLLSFTSDSTCMTLYNPSSTVLKYVQTLAAANGLFVWFPRQYDI